MRIEIWSDVVCPWCYIGKRRHERALAGFEHAAEIEVVWRSFQLDPSAPTTPSETVAEHLGRKYGGGPAAGQQMIDRVEAVAAAEEAGAPMAAATIAVNLRPLVPLSCETLPRTAAAIRPPRAASEAVST